VQGTLGHTGGPDHPVPFEQLSFPTPAAPGAVSQAANGPVWFVEPGADRIASARDDESGQITEYDVPDPAAGVNAISAEPSGHGAWFTESARDSLGHIDGAGTIGSIPLPAGADPSAVSATTDGGAWVTEPGLERAALVSGNGHVQKALTGGVPTSIAAVPGTNSAWVTDAAASFVANASPGVSAVYRTPTPSSRPTAIVGDGDGGAWFIESAAGQFGHIDGAGEITEYPLPSGDTAVQGLAAGPGPDGSTGGAWFSEPAAGQIGFISNAGAVDEFTLPGAAPGALTVASTLSAPPLSGYDASDAVWWTDAVNGQLGLARFPLGAPGSVTSTASPYGAVSVAAARSVTVRRSMVSLTVRCVGLVSCSGDATLRHQVRGPHAPPVLASRGFRVHADHSAVLHLALNGRGRGLVAGARRAGLHAGLTVQWSSYGHQVVRLMTLHAPRRRVAHRRR
jgi:virginiamycin B lyase